MRSGDHRCVIKPLLSRGRKLAPEFMLSSCAMPGLECSLCSDMMCVLKPRICRVMTNAPKGNICICGKNAQECGICSGGKSATKCIVNIYGQSLL